jgi:hypothetical protein
MSAREEVLDHIIYLSRSAATSIRGRLDTGPDAEVPDFGLVENWKNLYA